MPSLEDINGKLEDMKPYKTYIQAYKTALTASGAKERQIKDVDRFLKKFEGTEKKLKEQRMPLLRDKIGKTLKNIKKTSLSAQDLMRNRENEYLRQIEEKAIDGNLYEIRNYKKQLEEQLGGKPSKLKMMFSKGEDYKLWRDIDNSEKALIKSKEILKGKEFSKIKGLKGVVKRMRQALSNVGKKQIKVSIKKDADKSRTRS
ncbi:MAG: hypothetical protein HRU36_00205 [Rickettsiales bacterium]|nr:hypothetical protein [Rickettsiales bacterium]